MTAKRPTVEQLYHESLVEYERRTGSLLKNANTVILSGSGCRIYVDRGELVCRNGWTHYGQEDRDVKYYRGLHTIENIIILGDSGSVTLDAIKWCQSQVICVIMLDYDGKLIQTLTPEHKSSSELRR